jgi:uncharacterized protein
MPGRVLRGVTTHKLLVSVVLCLAFSNALAAYPTRTSSSIMDLADVLPAKDEASLLQSIAWFRRNTGGEMVVVTLPSWQALGVPDKTWESFSTNLFNRWRLGSATRNDGVLFMAAIKERKLRIELGRGFSRCYDSTMKQILTQDVVPLFKETRYGAGMALGSKHIIQSLPKVCPTETVKTPAVYTVPSIPTPALRFVPPPAPFPWMPFGGAALAVGALWYGLRRRAKACPNCRAPLELLSEQADDEYLEPAARLEEILGSVNYRVYRCGRCNHHHIEIHKRWFSGYSACPACQRTTLEETQTTLEHATTRRVGLALLTHHCRHCQHHAERQVRLPRLQERHDSHDGSSSFYRRDTSRDQTFVGINSGLDRIPSGNSDVSGGKSDGGGASADW